MGCVQCKICIQQEEKSQFEYSNSNPNPKKKEDIILNENINCFNCVSEANKYQKNDSKFIEEFNQKIKLIGKYISEEDFDALISELTNINSNIPKESFPFKKNDNTFSYKMPPVELEQGNIYYGEWNENMEMDGNGKYYLKKEKVLAEGLWEQGELKKARIYYPTGEYYEGEISNSIYNGKGKFINENKDEYIGEFLDGEKNGQGKLNFNDGTTYEGIFLKNKFYGRGVIKWKNGINYTGNFVNNFIEGNGVLNFEKEKYEGNFEKNLFHGKGKYTYINGDEYDGDFEYGIRKGKGVYKINNNDNIIFEGMWDNNVPNGFGKFDYNNNIIKCNYHNGNIIEKPEDENGLNYNNINYNFFEQKMNLSGIKLPHIEQFDNIGSQFKADSVLSFLEE